MKKLFEVTKTYYVMAENTLEAEEVSTDYGECTVVAYEADSVIESWHSCIPFNSDDDKTCGDIIGENKK